MLIKHITPTTLFPPRCLGAVATGLRSPWKPRRQTDVPDHGSVVTRTTPPQRYGNQAFEMEQVWEDSSETHVTMETTIVSPPPKPQRSFKNKQQEEQETTAYLEGCDHMKEEKETEGVEEVAGRSLEERSQGCDEETKEEEERELYILEDGRSQTETDEDEYSEEGEEKDGRESRKEKKEWRQEKEAEEAHEQKRSRDRGEGRRGSEEEEEVRGNKEKGRDGKTEEEGSREEKERDDGEKKRSKEDGETDMSSEDNETGSKKQEDTERRGTTGGEPASSPPSRGRRSRVIRVYQYDEDGQRYCHFPDPAPDEPGPAPRLKQRSLSLTRLNAIMAAASARPLEREERPHFRMEI